MISGLNQDVISWGSYYCFHITCFCINNNFERWYIWSAAKYYECGSLCKQFGVFPPGVWCLVALRTSEFQISPPNLFTLSTSTRIRTFGPDTHLNIDDSNQYPPHVPCRIGAQISPTYEARRRALSSTRRLPLTIHVKYILPFDPD